ELAFNQFESVRPLFAPLNHYLPIDSILVGLSPGKVFVDDAMGPETAVAWVNHRVFLAGDSENPAAREKAGRFFNEAFIPQRQETGMEGFGLHAAPEWAAHIPELLSRWHPIPRQRLYYRQDARHQDWPTKLPDDFTLRPVDAALLADEAITNMDFVTEEMVSERPSIADFLAKSFGYCAVRDDEVVGWCMSEYNAGPRCELGVAVLPPYRRRGLAVGLATAVIRQALAHNIHDIGWICWGDNHASSALAEKLGFERVDDGVTHQLIFDPAVALAVRGNLCFGDGRYAEAATFYVQATQQGSAPAWVHWNAACAHALTQQETAAFRHLQQAIAAGFDDWERLQNSPHLAVLRDKPMWQIVVNSR
ncbi:MAG: GNAT family N-acetyltransferase, partial [Chloroflexi bacterium]|nr:GNAT family N-acetyltransferase [Chloroflexota bacterium]